MKRKVQMRWSGMCFRTFREVSAHTERAEKHESHCGCVTFRTFRSPGNYGKLLFPPFREETTYRGVVETGEVSAASPRGGSR